MLQQTEQEHKALKTIQCQYCGYETEAAEDDPRLDKSSGFCDRCLEHRPIKVRDKSSTDPGDAAKVAGYNFYGLMMLSDNRIRFDTSGKVGIGAPVEPDHAFVITSAEKGELLTVSPQGVVWVNKDIQFSDVEHLDVDRMKALVNLLNLAIDWKEST